MPNSGRTADEDSTNGPSNGAEARDVARFPRPAEPLRGFTFGGFVLDLARGALLHDGSEVRLRAKSLDVLAYLVRHPGRLVAKRELMEAVWADVAVTDDSLVQCLVEIRRALGDDQAWIHTSRGRGYRFDGDVRPLLVSGEAPAATSTDGSAVPAPMPVAAGSAVVAASQARAWGAAVAVVAVVSLSAATWAVWGRATTPAPRTAEAARAFAEGMRSANRPNRESLASAVDAFERAIALDPSFAPAHAALANTLVVRGVSGRAPRRSGPSSSTRPWRRDTSRSGTCGCSGTATGVVRRRAIAARSRSIRTRHVRTCSMPCSSTRWAAPTRRCARARPR